MTDAPVPPRPPEPPFVERVGRLLVTPVRALSDLDARGVGGFRDAMWLVVLGVLAFRLSDVARGLFGLSHLSIRSSIAQTLAPLSREMIEAAAVVVPAALLITVMAGRGRRDPGRDLELGAAVFVPFFAVRAVYRVLDLEALAGPLPAALNSVVTALASAVALFWLLFAIKTARARGESRALSPSSSIAPRLAFLPLGLVLGTGALINAAWVARHGDTIKPLQRGSEAPGFALPRLDGSPQPLALSSLRGQVVLLDFWATWCPPCVQMLPTLHQLRDDFHARGFEVVGVNTEGGTGDLSEIQAFLRAHPSPYPMVLDDGRVAAQYKVVALPHFVLLDRQGAVVKIYWGYTTRLELESGLRAALGS